MKKIIKVDGLPRAEINISPQTNHSWNDEAFPLKDTTTYLVSASIGNTAFMSVHNIPPSRVPSAVMQVEESVREKVEAIWGENSKGDDLWSYLLKQDYVL